MFQHKKMLWAAATVLALAFGGAGYAATLASPPTYGGSPVGSGGTVSCRVFNSGAGTATILIREIIANSNASITPTFDSCGAPLGASQNCEYDAPIPGNLAFACRITVQGTGASLLRGVTEVTSTSGAILNVQAMR